MAIPSRQESFQLLWQHNVPDNVIRHSIVVSRVAAEVAAELDKKGKKVNLRLLDSSAILHDIGKLQPEHEKAGFNLLVKHGYREVAEVILTHPLHYILDRKNRPKTIEQKILHYADKRVMHHKVVPVKERLADLRKRYPQYQEKITRAEPLVLKLEAELYEDVKHKGK